jgi:methyl-accepting chemotaxis protein
MESVIIQLNQSHLKDLKTFFDETKNLKNILNTTLDRLQNISEKVNQNVQKISKHEEKNEELDDKCTRLRNAVNQVDQELQK